MVDIKPLLQGFLWILASMAAALMVIHVRELFWPRQEIIINIPYGNRKLYARVKQVSKELESVQSSVREVVSFIRFEAQKLKTNSIRSAS